MGWKTSYEKGRDAYACGVPIETGNPYPKMSGDYYAWFEGWISAYSAVR